MGGVKFDHVEIAGERALGGPDELLDHALHVGRSVHLARHLIARRPRNGRRRDKRPVADRQWFVLALPWHLGRAFRPGVTELKRNFRVGLGVYEIDDATPRAFMVVGVYPGAARV